MLRFRVATSFFLGLLAASPAVADDSLSGSADSQEFSLDGYVDIRLVHPSDEHSWMEGGLGKLRFDRAPGEIDPVLAEIVAEASAQVAPDLLGFLCLRYTDDQRTPIDALQAYVRYRPVSTTAWRWSMKVGAFFPPVSLENDELGWSSYWTLTPSAINSWVGDELRTIGGEGKIEWRGERDTIDATAAVFGANDPAGVLIDLRGWSLNDRPTGLFDRVRLPGTPAFYYSLFREIDDRAGWYTSASWERKDLGRVTATRYDNEADPTATRDGQIAWHTKFWSGGLATDLLGLTILAQGMTGETEVNPSPDYDRRVEFQAVYVLAGLDFEQWRLATRFDVFGTDAIETISGAPSKSDLSEHGYAVTFSATWLPETWLRLSGEALLAHSYRRQREETGLDPNADELQLQTSARIYY